MAMECVPLIIGTIVEITKAIFKSTSNSDLGESMTSMTRALKELTEARKDLETQVEQSELLGHPTTNQIKGWLERVTSVEAEVTLIIEDIDLVKQSNCCWNCNCSLRYNLNKTVRQKLTMINDLKEKNLTLNGANRGIIPPDMEVVPSGPTIGLDVMLERVHQLLKAREVATLGIYGITITESHTLQKLALSKTLLRCIQYLYITECEGLVILPLSTIPDDGKRLRRLSVNNCRDLIYLKTGTEDGKNWLPSLEVLALYRLPSLTIVWKNPVMKGSLQNLRSVNIWYCDKLKNISWIFQLPKLEMLYLFYCKEIEQVIGRDQQVHAEGVVFPCLRAISIRDLPSLTSIAHQAIDFPCLQTIAVINCPKLKKLPLKVSGDSNLPTVYGDREWWNRLEWITFVKKPWAYATEALARLLTLSQKRFQLIRVQARGYGEKCKWLEVFEEKVKTGSFDFLRVVQLF
ncbi:hypothetical protein L2E82_02926 [Cichorium intybus]|uniref:Uncharacterized protein n=1 Tax=Cichorium intybus TaxID=13427 RepID=A0ACB9H3L5_CICIN|nr:hypothetical protein L2E82_02926 [Cichorium intybus]